MALLDYANASDLSIVMTRLSLAVGHLDILSASNDQFVLNGQHFTYLGTVAIDTNLGATVGFEATAGGQNYYFFRHLIGHPTVTLLSVSPVTPASNSGDGMFDVRNDLIGCFLAGTRIATPGGLVVVECLKAGELVMTQSGVARPLRWLGRSTTVRVLADPLDVLPVRIAAGALGPALPQADLLVSPGHALALGSVLVQAGALVNGSTIRREHDVPLVFPYYHIELDRHDLLLAEGVAAESFIDGVEAIAFDNADERPLPPLGLTELAMPRARSARQVPHAVRRMVAVRTAMLAPEAAVAA